MLFRGFEKIKEEDYHGQPARGIVVDNDDPLQLGRLKIEIPGRWPIGDYDKLPWVFPRTPFGLGGKITNSSFSVPEIGSELIIIFPYNIEYTPFYIGYYQSATTHQNLLYDEDYPHTYGFSDSQMFWVRVNKKEEYLELFHYSGFTARMYDDGNVHINIPENLTINVGSNFLLNVGGKEVVEIGDTSSKIVYSDRVLNVKGSNNYIIESGEYKSIWGYYSRDVLGISTFDVTGYKSEYTSINCTMVVGNDLDIEVTDCNFALSGSYRLYTEGSYNIYSVGNYNEHTESNKSIKVEQDFKIEVDYNYSKLVTIDNIYEVGGSNYTTATGFIVEEASAIYMNSGISAPSVLDLDEPVAPDSAINIPTIDPSDPIGHGTLAFHIAILLAKVASLQLKDETLKILEEVAYEIRTKMTSLGAGEYEAKVSTAKQSNVVLNYVKDKGNVISLLKDIDAVETVQDNLENIDASILIQISANDIAALQVDLVANINVLDNYSLDLATSILVEMLDLVDSFDIDLNNFINNISNTLLTKFTPELAEKIIKKNVESLIANSNIKAKENILQVAEFLYENDITSLDIDSISSAVLAKIKPTIIKNLKINLQKTIKTELLDLIPADINNLLVELLTLAGNAESIIIAIQNPDDPISRLQSKLDQYSDNTVLLKNINKLIEDYNAGS